MALKARSHEKTRQIYASIREDLYLSAKARATELRIPLKKFLEQALEQALGDSSAKVVDGSHGHSLWDMASFKKQLDRPIGAPISLSLEEAEAVLREASDGNRLIGPA